MKLTTLAILSVFTLGSGAAIADHRYSSFEDRYQNHHDKRHRHANRHQYGNKHKYDRYHYGRVLNVEPVYRYQRGPEGHDSCLRYNDRRPTHNSYAPTIFGAVIGGALGHRIGDAHGDADAAAIAGGVLGASLGHDISKRLEYNRNIRVQGPCTVNHHRRQRELVEYKVRYRYNGKVHHTRTEYDPGEWIKLNVDIRPA